MDNSLIDLHSETFQQQLRDKAVSWGHEIRAWNVQWQTGIYPGEMAAFLGMCDLFDVRLIVESGRGPHAYSTHILGEYSEKTGAKVISIDVSPVQEMAFEHQLKRFRNLTCIAGNSFDMLPILLRDLPEPIALLVDGPKLQTANRLSFVASTMYSIKLVAHHNCRLSQPWGQFAELFPGAFHYEELGLSASPEWLDFKRWEQQWVSESESYDQLNRPLELSSLAIACPSRSPESSIGSFRLLIKSAVGFGAFLLWIKWSAFKVRLVFQVWSFLRPLLGKLRRLLRQPPQR